MERDKNIQRILLKKETPEPSEKLEDRIMTDIFKTINNNSVNHRYLYLAWFFFIFGLVTGVLISAKWAKSDSILIGLNFSGHGLIIQILLSFVILLLFERLYRLTIEMRNKYFDIEIK